jgi:hypothetical protein
MFVAQSSRRVPLVNSYATGGVLRLVYCGNCSGFPTAWAKTSEDTNCTARCRGIPAIFPPFILIALSKILRRFRSGWYCTGTRGMSPGRTPATLASSRRPGELGPRLATFSISQQMSARFATPYLSPQIWTSLFPSMRLDLRNWDRACT